jgi:hypothetical protein
MIRGSNPGRGKDISPLRNVQTSSAPTQLPFEWVTGVFPGSKEAEE